MLVDPAPLPGLQTVGNTQKGDHDHGNNDECRRLNAHNPYLPGPAPANHERPPGSFLALIAPMFRTLAHLVAALVSVLSVLALSALPYGTGLLIGGLLGMAAGAEVERRIGRRTGGGIGR